MTRLEALEKLDVVMPTGALWYLNPVLTWKWAYDTVKKCVIEQPEGELKDWIIRRVNEVLVNKKRKVCPNCGVTL